MQGTIEVNGTTTRQMDRAAESRRAQAIKRLKAKSDFRIHLVTYVAVNALLVLVWAVTSSGYFWPIWPMAGWGIGVVLHGYTVYWGRSFTEAQIQREMESLGPSAG
jgi:2TM domain-containing protein